MLAFRIAMHKLRIYIFALSSTLKHLHLRYRSVVKQTFLIKNLTISVFTEINTV